MFVIPIAVVGYKVWENHKRGERTKEAQEPRSEEPLDNLLLTRSIEDDASRCRLTSLETMSTIEEEEEKPKPEGSLDEVISYWKDLLGDHSSRCHGPFGIRSHKEALTYHVIGNQGTNAFPFPKSCF